MSNSAKWGDLAPRVGSAVVMVIVAGVAIWLGGIWLLALLSLAAAGMVWECARLAGIEAGRTRDVLMPSVTAVLFVALSLSSSGLIIALPMAAGWSVAQGGTRLRALTGLYAFAAVLAAILLFWVRDVFGMTFMLWLVGVVIASDVMGYFAGRILGGPKFWPAISPKKTWSGTVAGWAGAALLGWLMTKPLTEALQAADMELSLPLVVLSVLLAFAAQVGDIAESFLKRRTGIKDSSNLIPGHGGLLDRFDGLIGAAIMFFLVWMLF